MLSIGRVQTPTLALIVKRQQEIDNFKPEQYWVLSTIYRDTLFTLRDSEDEDDNDSTNENKKDKKGLKGRITDEEQGRKALEAIEGQDFGVTSIATKSGNEAPPRLFDLTSLQVECNKKYSFSADETLKYIQSLYEKKLTTYPRVDTTFLSDDIYPKCPTILQGLLPYASLTAPLLSKKLPKSKKVFDNSKVTDHHAIIPTGVNPSNGDLTLNEKRVYDLVARHFIAVFYPDCKVSTTTVTGRVECKAEENGKKGDKLTFKANGKQVLDPGWRVCFGKWVETAGSWRQEKKNVADDEEGEKKDEDKMLPAFVKGERGPHSPTLTEKWTSPPKPYTEATLLRAMETAGKLVEDDELRDALKENGIGRPSTRAAIIETLFKRGYIRKVRKSLYATETGIHEELLKSAELTGRWEKKLRDIEAHRYDAHKFIDELKAMVTQIVQEVMSN